MANEDCKRKISLERADELKRKINDYILIKDKIPNGMSSQHESMILDKKEKILKIFSATEENWNDWRWQIKNRISDVKVLSQITHLDESEIKSIKKVQEKFRWSVSPYYASLIDDRDKLDPVKLQSIPTILELEGRGCLDPMGEEFTSPAGTITRRYPDRLIINVTNECAMYCRHCQRRRNIGGTDQHVSKSQLQESIQYIKNNPEIRDVLITGGDPLTLTDETLDWILKEVRAIPSVEIIRIGTRVLVTMPQRITENLVNILKRYHPIYVNTQFNHPIEITREAKNACDKLINAGILIGNQAVLLNGINNDKYIMRLLNQQLLKCRIRPYYIFHAKSVIGTLHFVTSIDDGIEVMEYLRGYTSGLAIPTYVINAPNGNGKVPILPQYLIEREKDKIKIRTWENKIFIYPNHSTNDLSRLLENKIGEKTSSDKE